MSFFFTLIFVFSLLPRSLNLYTEPKKQDAACLSLVSAPSFPLPYTTPSLPPLLLPLPNRALPLAKRHQIAIILLFRLSVGKQQIGPPRLAVEEILARALPALRGRGQPDDGVGALRFRAEASSHQPEQKEEEEKGRKVGVGNMVSDTQI